MTMSWLNFVIPPAVPPLVNGPRQTLVRIQDLRVKGRRQAAPRCRSVCVDRVLEPIRSALSHFQITQ